MKVVLLAGGLGTRLREETEYRPKPMVPIGGKPIMWHIMKNYANFSMNDFIVCLGYKGEVIREYFRDLAFSQSDVELRISATPEIRILEEVEEDGWNVTLVNTGEKSLTGDRLLSIKRFVNGQTFACTYGDGLSNVDLAELVSFHRNHGKIATLVSIQPPSRFGVLEVDKLGSVKNFAEKPQGGTWVNGGFFIFEPEVFNFIEPGKSLEEAALPRLVEVRELMAFKHYGFWQSMDTYRETQLLNSLWDSGNAPWKTWN